MTTRRRQPRIGNRRHIQVYLDEACHEQIRGFAQLHGLSFSRAARELLAVGAQTIQSNPDTHFNVD
jgi:hypothetical protein